MNVKTWATVKHEHLNKIRPFVHGIERGMVTEEEALASLEGAGAMNAAVAKGNGK